MSLEYDFSQTIKGTNFISKLYKLLVDLFVIFVVVGIFNLRGKIVFEIAVGKLVFDFNRKDRRHVKTDCLRKSPSLTDINKVFQVKSQGCRF